MKKNRFFDKKEKIGAVLLSLGVFFFYFYLSYNVPYCHDEWHWGLPERVELMKNGFRDYNGRYLGNILALIITRSVWWKAGILGIFSLWLYQVIKKGVLKEQDQKESFFIQLGAFFLLLAIPKTLFCQSYGWPAAFVNFVPPVILFLIYFFLTEQTYDGIVPQCTGLMTLFLLLLGFVTQLFAEHMTVFVVVYAVWMVFLGWMRHKKIYGLYLSYLFGALAGAVVMFSNSAYRNAADGTDSYKHIGFSVGALLEQFAGLWDDLLLNNWLLNILLAGTVLYLIGKREKNKFAATLFGLILCGYGTYSVFHRVNPSWYFVGNESLNQWIEVVLGMLFVGTVVAGIWRCEEKSRRASICMLVLCSVFVAMPLLAANPIGARCFFASYIFQVVALLKLLQDILKEKKNLYLPCVCVLTIVLALCVMYLRMFSIVGGTDRIRAQRISSGLENHQKELILPILPYSDYYWTTIPVNKTWEKRFKEFYHIPQDVAVKFQ